MYNVGDQVVYGIHGVCVVKELEQRKVDRKPVTYLVLEPVGQEGSRYLVPTHNAAAMGKLAPVLTQVELETLLTAPEGMQDSWIQDENHRKQLYRELIGSGDRMKLVQMIRTLYRHKQELAAKGKRCHLCDENFLRDAERLLINEAAIVLETDAEQAKLYLRQRLADGSPVDG